MRVKMIVVGMAVLVLATIMTYFYRIRPLREQEILAAQSTQFVCERAALDGGSRLFHFGLPHNRSLAILVLQRRADLGGNPEFQEIRLDRLGAMNPYIDLRPGTELEAKIL